MSEQDQQTSRERAYQEIEVLDALKSLEQDGLVKRVLRPDGQIGYLPTHDYLNNGREGDTG